MENNIFFKNNKKKFNPDIANNMAKKTMERRKSEFAASKTVYNSITNQVPQNVKTIKDLELKKDKPLSNESQILTGKISERTKQDMELKPQKMKTIIDNLIVDKHIENFDELKNKSEIFINENIKEQIKQKHDYYNIMENLKSLGILK
jgi:hypothetical protein